MMEHKTVRLQLEENKKKHLKNLYQQVINHLENKHSLNSTILDDLKKALSQIVTEDTGWQEVLSGLHNTGNFYCLHLLHEDNEILNLPWAMALDNHSNKPLGQIEQLVPAKGMTGFYTESPGDFSKLAPPLKILIIISSPEDAEWKHRLSYEEEELEILNAFSPLLQAGLVEIDFSGDGSLETMKQKLTSTRYHILHYTGHAGFHNKLNDYVLEMEDPVSLNRNLVTAREFADAVNCRPDYRVPMVVLSSCQTAQGNVETGLQGITTELMRKGIPVVISMGMSIIDRYAALFTAQLYRKMAEQQPLAMAFAAACRYLQAREFQDQAQAGNRSPRPLQWIIPNLYLSRPTEGIIDWTLAPQKQNYTSNRYIFEKDKLLLPHDSKYLFIGRRKDKAEILKPFLERKPVLLKGQGGVGKTALAEHLVQRLVAANPKTQPFVFNQKHKSIEEILTILKQFLMTQLIPGLSSGLIQQETGMEKFIFLLSEVVKKHQPVFVFDNLEDFQAGPGQEFSPEYAGLKEIIDFLCDSVYGQFHVILTCRYPVPGVKNLNVFDLNQVGLNDFWKTSFYLDVGHIRTYLQEAEAAGKNKGIPTGTVPQFIDIVKLLHGVFGGNYRCLEFFNQALKERPETIKQSLDTLEHFRENSQQEVEQVREQMGKNLLFTQLVALLTAGQQGILSLLAQFRVPVQEWALDLQMELQKETIAFKDQPALLPLLAGLQRLTLIEVSRDSQLDLCYYYVTPIVRNLLKGVEQKEEIEEILFDHGRAGMYFYNCTRNMEGGTTSLEESFYHYDRAGDLDKLEEIGDILSDFYDTYCMYHNAFFYANRVYELKGDETKGKILNQIGALYQIFGDYNQSLEFFIKAQVAAKKEGNKKAEGTLLNNISLIYSARGDYDTALHYLEKSLQIFQKIEDKKNEGVALNNKSQIYHARSDYDTALSYLKQVLKIDQELGDKAGEGTTLNNISLIYKARGDYDTALHYLEKSLKIRQEIGDKSGEGTTLNNISQIYSARGDYDTALHYLEKNLKIIKEIGDKSGEGTTLNNISLIYSARSEYDTALHYLEKSLKIRQELEDKSGEGATLNNLAATSYSRDDYDTALHYLEKSLKIRQELGDKSGMTTTLHNMAMIAYETEDIKKYMQYEQEAYRLAQETGDAFHIYRVGWELGDTLYQLGDEDQKKQALTMLNKSLEIGKKAGFPDVGELEEQLKQIYEHDNKDTKDGQD